MTISGWIFMLLYWGGLTTLLVYCLKKKLSDSD